MRDSAKLFSTEKCPWQVCTCNWPVLCFCLLAVLKHACKVPLALTPEALLNTAYPRVSLR